MSNRRNHLPDNNLLGDFVIGREIGRGGMGVVYEAMQRSLSRKVAVKVLASSIGLTPRAVQRFHREAEAAAKLHHTNIVPIYSTGEANGIHFYAMELIVGPSLDLVIRELRKKPTATDHQSTMNAQDLAQDPHELTGDYAEGSGWSSGFGLSGSSLTSGSAHFDVVARMISEVADALDYAHQQGVIHRDIKPSNLLLSPSDRLCINDFGLARMLEQPGMTMTGEMVGTPRYMSPEQITAGRIPVDHRTDIYSLGATLYELLTLQPPFSGDQRDKILAQVIQKEPMSPQKVNPKVPVDLETICLKAMDKDPDRRYQSAGQMADDLRRYLNRFAIMARRIGPIARLQKWARRNTALTAALAGVLLCVCIAAALAYRSHLAEIGRVAEREKHEANLLEERRRAALDKAILASRLEDFEGARKAIREAEKLGCVAGQVRMLQGQLELYQGHMIEAIDHLSQAVELLPTSVAARAMLSWAYANAGRMTEHYKAKNDALGLTPVTSDDFLFLAHTLSMEDPDRALKFLNEAMRLRPTSLAYFIRIDVLRLHVLNSPNVERAKTIMDDVRVIKRQFPDNVMVLSLSSAVHTVCYNVFGELQQTELRELTRTAGLEDAKQLERYGTSSRAVLARWTFLESIGQPEAALDDMRRICIQTQDSDAVSHLGAYLFRQGNFGEAVKVFEGRKGETAIDVVRLFALSELPDGLARAKELGEDIAARDLSDWDWFNSQLVFRFLGDNPRARELAEKILKHPDRFPIVMQETFLRTVEYCAGHRSAEELLAVVGDKRGDLCCAHFSIGLTSLADGNREKALRHLRLCVETRQQEFVPHIASRMLVSRMEQDKSWPPWIQFNP